jgi:hypothetical protein
MNMLHPLSIKAILNFPQRFVVFNAVVFLILY